MTRYQTLKIAVSK